MALALKHTPLIPLIPRTARYSDFTLICEGQKFPVHKIVVCERSSVIRMAAEGKFKESEVNSMTVNEFDPETVDRMLEYLYSGDYSGKVSIEADLCESIQALTIYQANMDDWEEDPLYIHAKVNAIGDSFNIPDLRTLANQKIEKRLTAEWDIDSFVHLLQIVSDTCSEDIDLRKIVTKAAALHINELVGHKGWRSLHMSGEVHDDIHKYVVEKLTVDFDRKHSQHLADLAKQLNDPFCHACPRGFGTCRPMLKKGSFLSDDYQVVCSICRGRGI